MNPHTLSSAVLRHSRERVARRLRELCRPGDDMSGRDLDEMLRALRAHVGADLRALMALALPDTVAAGAERPMLRLDPVGEKLPTLWMLGWRPGDRTEIHDHVHSRVGVHVLHGAVRERSWPVLEGELEGLTPGDWVHDDHAVYTELYEGAHVGLPAPYIHEFSNPRVVDPRWNTMAVTLHAYCCPLTVMRFYKVEGSELLYTGMWDEEKDPTAEEAAVVNAQ